MKHYFLTLLITNLRRAQKKRRWEKGRKRKDGVLERQEGPYHLSLTLKKGEGKRNPVDI